MNDERSGGGKYLQMILGALFVCFLGFQAWMARTLIDGQSGTNDRLTKIEATIDRNKEERNEQLRLRDFRIDDHAERIRRLEALRLGRGE
ncbi:MAG: hypothetical protein QOH86_1236 [Sphingomonadales bacterium]|nr:hypothetical protein [Sphingomonadales bacterium]